MSTTIRDETTLEVKVRPGVRFQDGEPCTAHSIRQNFDEVQKRAARTRRARTSTSTRTRSATSRTS